MYVYTLQRGTTKLGVVTRGKNVFTGQSHAVAYCTNASRGLSAIAEFLIEIKSDICTLRPLLRVFNTPVKGLHLGIL